MTTRTPSRRTTLLMCGVSIAACCADRADARTWSSSVASTYGIGDGFLGGPLACGGRLDSTTPVVAHKTLPCGTRVLFRHDGNRAVGVVRDRGPYVGGREWDLGPALERLLGFNDGVGSVDWIILPAAPTTPAKLRVRIKLVLRRDRIRVWRKGYGTIAVHVTNLKACPLRRNTVVWIVRRGKDIDTQGRWRRTVRPISGHQLIFSCPLRSGV